MDDLLFYRNGSLSDALRAQIETMKGAIADTPPERMNGATNDELVEYFVSEYRVEPLTIFRDRAEAEHKETKVDVSHDPFRLFMDEGGPVMVKGDQITIHVPFTGEVDLFTFTPSTRNLNPPRGIVRKQSEFAGIVSMTLALPSDTNDGGPFNSWIKQQLDGLIEYSQWIRDDLDRFNQQLAQDARTAVEARRQQLEKQGSLLQTLSIPLRPHPGAPLPAPIPMPKRIVKPLPPPQRVEQEYGISEADYEYILKIIRQESRSFESTPATFAKLDEEELRDVVLAHLNGHFSGDAAGERFRKHGKTDICIEHENRAAFVSECKLWRGPKTLKEGIDQLLGYLTWRDTRTALIVWNIHNKDFARLQAEFPDHFKAHKSFLRFVESAEAGEWRAAFRSQADEDREVLVHVFLVDLYALEHSRKT